MPVFPQGGMTSPPVLGQATPYRPAAAPARPAQAPQGLAGAPPRPVFRGQAPDEPTPRPAPLSIPSPEELGVSPARPAGGAADLAAARRRFKELGAVCFQIEDLPQGGCRIVCLLPTAQPERHHRIEAEAPTEAEAVRLALARADQWVAQR